MFSSGKVRFIKNKKFSDISSRIFFFDSVSRPTMPNVPIFDKIVKPTAEAALESITENSLPLVIHNK